MALTSRIRASINGCLRHWNLRLDTLTAENLEHARLASLDAKDHFTQPVFTLPEAFKAMDVNPLLEELQRYTERFNDFANPAENDVGFTFANDYFPSPDAEVLYGLVRKYQPKTFIEVGSGNSTKIVRQAIIDGGLTTQLVCIDPAPRLEVAQLADRFLPDAVEALSEPDLFRSLRPGDILFIDSSHEIKTGNDVVFLYLKVIPELPPGVLVHCHDIFLPYDYPRKWVIENRWLWNEQYLVQLMLTVTNSFEVLWAGHHLQRTLADFQQFFPRAKDRLASSLWLRKTNEGNAPFPNGVR